MKITDSAARTIDCRLDAFGIRVREDSFQLIARESDDSWSGAGRRFGLPMYMPQNNEEFGVAMADAPRLTAYLYATRHPDSDLAAVLSQSKDFSAALTKTAGGQRFN